mmetsp:Transcript_34837/g.52452  ORF Transcript_34837/g.52452 Transcript_34837/m.52452 type:complete len:84 (-) Transcript_34837:202-453(-)
MHSFVRTPSCLLAGGWSSIPKQESKRAVQEGGSNKHMHMLESWEDGGELFPPNHFTPRPHSSEQSMHPELTNWGNTSLCQVTG